MRRREVLLLGLLLLAYLALGVLFAVRTPAWQAPDEPAHYNYVRQLAEGALPVIQTGDWDQAYLSQIVGAEFDPSYTVDGITYEDWQPPLYYLLQLPVYRLSGGSLVAMRLLSVLLGAGVVALAYVVGRAVFGRVAPALAVAAFVAFLPQHLAILASVNNDALSELIIAAVLVLLVVRWPARPPVGRLLALGLLLGAGFLTKGQAYLMAPVVGVFLLARYWRPGEDAGSQPALHVERVDNPLIRGEDAGSQPALHVERVDYPLSRGEDAGSQPALQGRYWMRWRPLARALAVVFVPALLLGLLWWGRNAVVYGGLDVLARQAHDSVVVGQPRTSEWLAQYGLGGTLGRFVRTTFVSFWGQFGWMAAPLPGWMVGVVLALTGVAVVGLVARGLVANDERRTTNYELQATNDQRLTTKDQRPTTNDQRLTTHAALHILVLGLTFLLTLALHVAYNLTFVQHQGRYLYPALIPIGVGLVAGLGYWLRPFVRRWPWAEWLLPLGIGGLLIGMSLFALWRILPGLAPG